MTMHNETKAGIAALAGLLAIFAVVAALFTLFVIGLYIMNWSVAGYSPTVHDAFTCLFLWVFFVGGYDGDE